jgi:hypothetical protein
MRRYARSKLDREVDRLHRHGIPSVVLQPGGRLSRLLGADFMDGTRLDEIVAASYFDAASQLARPEVRDRLAGIDAEAARYAATA